MRTAKTISITMPPELLTKAQQFADREHRTMSELLREALRRYIGEDTNASFNRMNDIRESLREKAAELGIATEDDVVSLIHEQRRSKRA
jgi:metal-responsive CopG/Arc/MetJ family transcriptional regulator